MSLLKQYDSFLLNNASQITAVESTLRSITYFLPGRFKDAELAGEAIYSALNILGLYHDGILVRALNAEASSSSSARPVAGASASPLTLSEHARYTQHFSHKSKAYNVLARTLVVIGYLELLAEMTARRKLSKKRSWDVVAGIEAVKVLLRLSLLHATGGRTTIQPPIPEREVDPAMLEEERAKKMGSFANSLDKASEQSRLTEGAAPRGYWKGARTGYLRPTLASLRPGSQDAKVEELEGPAGLVDRRPPHLRALQIGANNSGSDSDDTLVDSARLNGTSSLSSSRAFGQNGTTTPATTAKGLPSPPASIEPWTEKQINDYLLSRVLNVNDVRKPDDLVRPLHGLMGKSAETLWILRPLIYVMALRRWGRKHTAPFLLSFALEYLARTMRVRSLTEGKANMLGNPLVMALMGENPMMGLMTALMGAGSGGKDKPISTVEEMEWTRRDRSFWWYLLRGPAWYGWTRPKLSNLVAKTENRALIGIVGGIVGDYLPLVDDYFYSTT